MILVFRDSFYTLVFLKYLSPLPFLLPLMISSVHVPVLICTRSCSHLYLFLFSSVPVPVLICTCSCSHLYPFLLSSMAHGINPQVGPGAAVAIYCGHRERSDGILTILIFITSLSTIPTFIWSRKCILLSAFFLQFIPA